MLLRDLSISGFRNIQHTKLTLSPRCNLLIGPNGAGKTAIIETIDVLSRGKSFRSHATQSLLREGSERLIIRATVEPGTQITVEKTLRKTTRQKDTEKGISQTEMANLLPLRILHPDSHQLIQGDSKQRRAFLDWGAFHVKQEFAKQWTMYHRALKQRNALLQRRADNAQIKAWDYSLSQYGERIDATRKQYLKTLKNHLEEKAKQVSYFGSLALEYQTGQKTDVPLAEALSLSFADDCRVGYTHVGPHRASMQIAWEGKDVAKKSSRGQQKLVAAILFVLQVAQFHAEKKRQCLFLIDDLTAELDEKHVKWLIETVVASEQQTIITMVDDRFNFKNMVAGKLFHVKHGTVVDCEE